MNRRLEAAYHRKGYEQTLIWASTQLFQGIDLDPRDVARCKTAVMYFEGQLGDREMVSYRALREHYNLGLITKLKT